MGRIIDLSMAIVDGMPTWPGDVEVKLWRHHTPAEGFSNVGGIQLGTHAGTHLDAPFHWFEDGATVDMISLARLCGPARVADVRERLDGLDITAAALADAAGQIGAGERLLILTGWRGQIAGDDYPALTPDAAGWLVAREPALVGIDTPSVDGPTAGHAHELLLGAGIPVIELLVRLEELVDARFGLYALPLPITGTDGAPVRAVAVLG